MPLSQTEIDSLINDFIEKFDQGMAKHDAKALAELYHPHATFVTTGVKCDYGREAILKALELFLESVPPLFKMHPELNAEAGNDEYLITRGYYTWKDATKRPYEMIFKKGPDGKYLAYHDEMGV
ncbi:hypothetical protein DdX_15155 [Ditylenchus destructor]|uniref:DUF4440 domain-containing protein n=1 Tax=Ditylenchus destructor TaxID=166010 RepID=A0AAD4MPY2_9BILA|nr:hypothetical protein DdX_15155 [Ditylenchus destructor]